MSMHPNKREEDYLTFKIRSKTKVRKADEGKYGTALLNDHLIVKMVTDYLLHGYMGSNKQPTSKPTVQEDPHDPDLTSTLINPLTIFPTELAPVFPKTTTYNIEYKYTKDYSLLVYPLWVIINNRQINP